MNSWKFNSSSQYFLKRAICNFFNIHYTQVYKKVKSIDGQSSVLTTKEGEKYLITLKKL
jgi:hypothetical protein